MAKYKMSKTFETWNMSALEAGETDNRGYEYEDNEFDSLWQLAKEIRDEGGINAASNAPYQGMYYSSEPEIDYKSGEHTIYAFHPHELSKKETDELDKMISLDDSAFKKLDPEA